MQRREVTSTVGVHWAAWKECCWSQTGLLYVWHLCRMIPGYVHLEGEHQQRKKHTWRRPGGLALCARVRRVCSAPVVLPADWCSMSLRSASRPPRRVCLPCSAPDMDTWSNVQSCAHCCTDKCCYLHGHTDRQCGTPWAIRSIVTLSLEDSLPREAADLGYGAARSDMLRHNQLDLRTAPVRKIAVAKAVAVARNQVIAPVDNISGAQRCSDDVCRCLRGSKVQVSVLSQRLICSCRRLLSRYLLGAQQMSDCVMCMTGTPATDSFRSLQREGAIY